MRRETRILLGTALLIAVASAARADLRTKSIRLVADEDWKPTPQPISIASEVRSDDAHAAELHEAMDRWIAEGFQKLGYEIRGDAPVEVRYTIDYVDWGSRVRRLVAGFNDSGVGGTVVVQSKGKVIGRFRYSSKLRGGFGGGSANAMGKEVAAPLALKIHNCERDDALHERKLD